MSANADAQGPGSGEFSSRAPREGPMTTHGHQPGQLVGNDAAPEFSAETLPAGTAPKDRTFAPQNDPEVAAGGDTKASDTVMGATSSDVHAGLGKPVQGQSSAEVRHDGQSHRKNVGQGLDNKMEQDGQ
nr:hypothetical protein CFP56_67327 [Quercus suber]